jgi:hypothetical protein
MQRRYAESISDTYIGEQLSAYAGLLGMRELTQFVQFLGRVHDRSFGNEIVKERRHQNGL